MLILFHYITILIYQLLRHRKRIKCLHAGEVNYNHRMCNNFYLVNTRPEVQKYCKLLQILEDEQLKDKIEKLVDLGSGNLSIIYTLLEVANLNQILLVDIDEELLRQSISSLDPHVYIPHLSKRLKHLDISILAGNAADSDYRLLRTDAITAVNLLESLYPDALDALPYNIFTFVEPKVVIFITSISTSLSDISGKNCRSLWSREQFEDWSNNVKIRFPDYNCHFEMIHTPRKTDFSWLNLSEISEVALFLRRDLLDPRYILTSCSTQCHCQIDSPCRIISTSSKMLCRCVCPLCCPSSSFGVCNYFSSTKMAMSFTENGDYPPENPDFNIYYKVVAHSALPCEDEDIAEENEEGTVDEVNQPSEVSSGEETDEKVKTRCLDTTGNLTERELMRILLEQDYKFEECRFEQHWKSRHHFSECPTSSRTYDMEEITSNTEAPDYDSDCVKKAAPKDSPSECEENGEKKSDATHSSSLAKDISGPESSDKVEAPAQKQDALVDSGYQKSPSPIEDSPLDDLEEADLFEETRSTPSVDSDDNKVHLRRASGSMEKPHLPPLQPDFAKFKLDVNRINELDKFHNIPPGRTFFNHMLKSQDATRRSFLKDRELPGPSTAPLSPRKRKKHKKPLGGESEEDSPFDDCKSITNCLIKNTLNKLEVNEADEQRHNGRDDVIEFNVEPEVVVVEAQEPEVVVVEGVAEQEVAVLEQEAAQQQDVVQQAVPEALPAGLVVENGDLANNNRDIEGNNYIAPENQEIVENDIENFNLIAIEAVPEVHLVQEIVNANDMADNNNLNAEDLQVIEDPAVLVEGVGDNENDQNNAQQEELDQPEPAGVARASREALFDPNSEPDLLEDVDLPLQQEEPSAMDDIGLVDVIEYGNNIVLIGVAPNPDDQDAPVDVNAFPRWLLQILGAQVGQNEEGTPDDSEEPHFYCQGDGLGIHPSVIAVDADEDEESTQSSNTGEYADVEQEPSSQDASSLPEESQPLVEPTNNIDDDVAVEPTTSQQTEFFDSDNGEQTDGT